ncbi:MAG: flagellin, partial [SAR324 cluster bacterium]|nr:flagellin [SAR324 cluster bacterium]
MNLRINEDPVASAPVRRLSEAYQATVRSLERLASGQRINRAADDPGALVTSEILRSEIASIGQAVRNTEVSVSMIQTAEGALAEVNNLLIEIRQTALAAANSGAGDFAELAGLQSELRYALQSIDRVSRFTRFGNRALLDGSQGVTGVGNSDDLTFVSATEQTRSSPIEGYPIEVTKLPLQAKLVGDLTDSDADGLRVILEEEDGGLVDVSNVPGAGAHTFVSRLQRAVEDTNLNLKIQYDVEESELTITHREYGLAKGFMLTTSKQGVLGSESYAP